MIQRNQVVGQATFERVARKYFKEVIMNSFQIHEDQGEYFSNEAKQVQSPCGVTEKTELCSVIEQID